MLILRQMKESITCDISMKFGVESLEISNKFDKIHSEMLDVIYPKDENLCLKFGRNCLLLSNILRGA